MSLTIVITASFVPSHPSLRIIQETLESLRYTNCDPSTPIVLAHDYNSNPDYLAYLEQLRAYIKGKLNIQVVVAEVYGCLTGNVRNALRYVNTEFMMLMQHDLPYTRSLPDLYKVMDDMKATPSLKHVRFNRLVNTHNMYDKFGLFGKQVSSTNYTYTRTPGWSDNNHLCLTSYYKDFIMKECPDKTFMEGHLYWKIKDEASHETYGTYLFGPLDEPPYTGHSDGRHSTFTKKIAVLSDRPFYKTISEAVKEEYTLTIYNPFKFVMVDFQKSVRDADLCLADYKFYKDVFKIVPAEYHAKFNLVCSDISETHYYGSEIIYDSFSVSISEERLRPHIKREARLVRPDATDDWRVLFKAMIHKQQGVRIYTKGSFDLFHCGHVAAFEELKRSYPKSTVTIGVLKEAGSTILTHEERIASVRGCKYVDEVLCDPPVMETEAFLKKYNIDIVATDAMDFAIPCATILPIQYRGPDIKGRILDKHTAL